MPAIINKTRSFIVPEREASQSPVRIARVDLHVRGGQTIAELAVDADSRFVTRLMADVYAPGKVVKVSGEDFVVSEASVSTDEFSDGRTTGTSRISVSAVGLADAFRAARAAPSPRASAEDAAPKPSKPAPFVPPILRQRKVLL